VAIAEGAHFRGAIDMQRASLPASGSASKPTVKESPVATPAPVPAAQKAAV
jgi:hypothetical protein